MKFFAILLFFLSFVFIPFQVHSQIFYTPEKIFEELGESFISGEVEKNKQYMLYDRPFYTKTSGDYIQRKIFYFEEGSSGEKICTRFSIIEPSSETKINRDIYNRDLPQVGPDQWFDESTGVYYKIEEPGGYCLITVWVGEAEPEKIENKLFKI